MEVTVKNKRAPSFSEYQVIFLSREGSAPLSSLFGPTVSEWLCIPTALQQPQGGHETPKENMHSSSQFCWDAWRLGRGCALSCPCPPPTPSLPLGAPVQPSWHTLGSSSHAKSCLFHWSRADHARLPAVCLAIFASNMMYGELCVSLSLPYDAVRSLSAFYIPSAYLTALIKYLLSYLCNESEYYSLTRHLHIQYLKVWLKHQVVSLQTENYLTSHPEATEWHSHERASKGNLEFEGFFFFLCDI